MAKIRDNIRKKSYASITKYEKICFLVKVTSKKGNRNFLVTALQMESVMQNLLVVPGYYSTARTETGTCKPNSQITHTGSNY